MNQIVPQKFNIRPAEESDVNLILQFIKGLGAYEKLSHEVVATEEKLHKTLFQQKMAEVIIGEYNGQAVGFALFFHNYSKLLLRTSERSKAFESYRPLIFIEDYRN